VLRAPRAGAARRREYKHTIARTAADGDRSAASARRRASCYGRIVNLVDELADIEKLEADDGE